MSSALSVALLFMISLPTGADDAQKPPKLPAVSQQTIDFARDVEPILVRSCVSCHGPVKQRGGLRLDDGGLTSKGGNSGPAYKMGDSGNSRLIHLVAGLDPELKMPPKEKTPLTSDEVALLRAWIDQGAKWPRHAAVAGASRKSEHWAYQPIREISVPATKTWLGVMQSTSLCWRSSRPNRCLRRLAERTTLIRRITSTCSACRQLCKKLRRS